MQLFAWDTVKKEMMNEKVGRKFISGDRITIAQIFIAKGGVVPTHQHESEQISQVIEGALRFEVEGQEIIARAGDVLQIPSNVPHRVVGLEDSRALDIFSPVRIDWLTGQDSYFRNEK